MSKILVIDDDREVRQSILTVLQASGHDVVDCANAYDGMLAIDNHTFDVAVIDIILPDMDGLEVIGNIKKTMPNIKIIAISGGGEHLLKSYLPAAEAFGAVASLEKPFEAQELLDAVNDNCGN